MITIMLTKMNQKFENKDQPKIHISCAIYFIVQFRSAHYILVVFPLFVFFDIACFF